MKLTLSEVTINVERRYTLDEPSVFELRAGGPSYLVSGFVTVTRTYQYGEVEQEFRVRARPLKKDGTPDKREQVQDITLYAPSGDFADLLPDPRKVFIDALNDAVDEGI